MIEEVLKPYASPEGQLLASSQKTVAVEGSTTDVIRSTYLLSPIAGTSGSEPAGGLDVSSLEITIAELDITNTCHSTPALKPLTLEVPYGTRAENRYLAGFSEKSGITCSPS